jgi:hypothetical protein
VNLRQHLTERHLDLNLHRPFIDEELCVASFFLYNLSGQIVGIQKYKPLADKKPYNTENQSKYYTYRRQDTIGIWGLESIVFNTPIFITEGIFDASRLTHRKITAFALLCNNPPKDYWNWLSMLKQPIIAVCDSDAAGSKLRKFGSYVETVPDGKDLGESDEAYIDWLIQKYVPDFGVSTSQTFA